jgi:4-amino-4-deoxy-L-arabinose transferase-like glycosyltransferase
MHQTAAYKILFWMVLLSVASALLVRSQIYAYVGDESFHLLAAQLLNEGKRPYADFFYQHTPLYIYLIAVIMRLAGQGWKVVHLFSTLSLIGSSVIASIYARRLFVAEAPRWLCASLVLLFIGLNCYVLVFATTGLPFGFCLLCLVAALYLSRSKAKARLFFAGLFAGAAAAANLLVLLALAVLLFWILRRERARSLFFIIGIVIPFIPLLILLVASSQQTILDVFKYHLLYRPNQGWRFNLREIIAWFMSAQGVVLTVLALAVFWFRRDDEVRLCGWITLALVLGIACARTTFAFYFLLATPFMAILAAVAVVEVWQRVERPANAVVVLIVSFYLIGLLGLKYVWRWEAPYFDYRVVESVRRELESCAPGGQFYAFEAVYFETHRLPPKGMENRFDPFFQGDRLLEENRVDAVAIGSTDPRVAKYALFSRYARTEKVTSPEHAVLIFCGRVSSPVIAGEK